MKRLKKKGREWLLRQTRIEWRAQKKPATVRRSYKPGNEQAPRPTRIPRTPSYANTIVLPEDFNLSDGYLDVVRCLRRIRAISDDDPDSLRTYIDFRQIKTLSTAGALVLAAELDRWNIVGPGSKLRPVDVGEWDRNIVMLLDEMGFFNLLEVPKKTIRRLVQNRKRPAGKRFMPFRKGTQMDAPSVHQHLTAVIEKALNIDLMHLDPSIQEAILNVTQHAYMEQPSLNETLRPDIRHWWISASYNREDREFRAIAYDHGWGIPVTLPNQDFFEGIPFLGSSSDANLIEQAFDLPRSETGLDHRGRGLQENVRKYIDDHESDATLSVLSNAGMYEYRKEGGKIIPSKRHLPLSIHGTLVEWHVCLED